MEWSEELSTQFCQVLSPDMERKAMKGTGRGEQTVQSRAPGSIQEEQ